MNSESCENISKEILDDNQNGSDSQAGSGSQGGPESQGGSDNQCGSENQDEPESQSGSLKEMKKVQEGMKEDFGKIQTSVNSSSETLQEQMSGFQTGRGAPAMNTTAPVIPSSTDLPTTSSSPNNKILNESSASGQVSSNGKNTVTAGSATTQTVTSKELQEKLMKVHKLVLESLGSDTANSSMESTEDEHAGNDAVNDSASTESSVRNEQIPEGENIVEDSPTTSGTMRERKRRQEGNQDENSPSSGCISKKKHRQDNQDKPESQAGSGSQVGSDSQGGSTNQGDSGSEGGSN